MRSSYIAGIILGDSGACGPRKHSLTAPLFKCPTERDGQAMEQEMAEWAAAIRVAYRFIDGHHVYTSDDVYGLYIANQDAGKAYDAIAPSLEKLIKLNEGIACHVEPTLTYSELVRTVHQPGQPLTPEITSRSFVARAA